MHILLRIKLEFSTCSKLDGCNTLCTYDNFADHRITFDHRIESGNLIVEFCLKLIDLVHKHIDLFLQFGRVEAGNCRRSSQKGNDCSPEES